MNVWHNTWLAMADYDPVRYEAIKRMEIAEYYNFFNSWKKRMQAKLDNANKHKHHGRK